MISREDFIEIYKLLQELGMSLGLAQLKLEKLEKKILSAIDSEDK